MSLEQWVRAQPGTVTEVAAQLGLGRVALHRYMAGRVMPRPEAVRRIESATGGAVRGEDLLAGYRGAAGTGG